MNPGQNGRSLSLKSPILISALFSKGQRHFQYPLILIRATEPTTAGKVVFSVSKKKFKRAVDRNRIKRQLRAVFFSLQKNTPETHLALVYVGAEFLPTLKLAEALQRLLGETTANNGPQKANKKAI